MSDFDFPDEDAEEGFYWSFNRKFSARIRFLDKDFLGQFRPEQNLPQSVF